MVIWCVCVFLFMIGGACFCAAVVAFFIKVYLRVIFFFLIKIWVLKEELALFI